MSPGHDVWTYVPEEGDAQLRGYYALESNWGALEAQVLRGTDAQIVIVDPELNEREESRTPGPGAVATLGEGYGTADADSDGELDGLPLYIYQNDDPAGKWRGIFMADDNGGVHSPKWRTHTPVRMLTANAGLPRCQVFQVWYDNSNTTWSVLLPENALDLTYIKEAFAGRKGHDELLPHIRYEERRTALRIIEGKGGYLEDADQQQAVHRHVATVYQTVGAGSETWPGQTQYEAIPMLAHWSHGRRETPDRCCYSSGVISDRFPDGQEGVSRLMGRSNVVLHELGHAAGHDGHDGNVHCAEGFGCVMFDSIDSRHYRRFSNPWGAADPHRQMHCETIRGHVMCGDKCDHRED